MQKRQEESFCSVKSYVKLVIVLRCLICIHGLLSSQNDFSYFYPHLKPYYDRIALFDMPGHGKNTLSFTTKNIQKFYLEKYQILAKTYDEIDLLGYSLGGVIACYLQSVCKIRKMILLAPAYRYLNLKNYHFHTNSSNLRISKAFPKKNFFHLFRFQKIVYQLSNEFSVLYPETLILWGEDDYLVKPSSGEELYSMIRNKNRQYIVLKNHNHFNIVSSRMVLYHIQNFIE